MNLIAIRGAKDFHSGDSIDFHVLHDHHIFPDAMLKKAKDDKNQPRYKTEQISTILNRTLISDDTNQLIKDKPPSDYVTSIVPKHKRAAILQAHFIDASALKAMERDDYISFLKAREAAILSHLRSLVGDPDK